MAMSAKTPKVPKVRIDWAYLDIKTGRARLRKIIGERNDPVRHRIPVTITGFLDEIHSGDDGVSQEFAMTVTGVEVIGEPARWKSYAAEARHRHNISVSLQAESQHKDHWTLCPTEIMTAGFKRPVREWHTHLTCGGDTRMPSACAATYAADPHYYGSTFCCHCGGYFPVWEAGEFWGHGR